MKKVLVSILALAMLFSMCTAIAAEIKPIDSFSMEDDLTSNIFNVGFKMADVTEEGIQLANVFTEMRYDMGDVEALQVGDTIIYKGEPVQVESVEFDYSAIINGGALEGGITLCPEGGAYLAIIEDNADYMALGSIDLPFADEMTFYHWGEDENGEIILAGATEVKASPAELLELLRAEGCEEFLPAFTSVQTEDGKLFSISINYTP